MESRTYQSETIDYTYLSLEIEDGHGVLYEIFEKDEVFDTTYICDVYADGYDADLDWFQLEFVQSIFPNIQRI